MITPKCWRDRWSRNVGFFDLAVWGNPSQTSNEKAPRSCSTTKHVFKKKHRLPQEVLQDVDIWSKLSIYYFLGEWSPIKTSNKTNTWWGGMWAEQIIHPWRLTWNIIMEVWKIIFLSKWVICRFHVNLPGCIQKINQESPYLLVSWRRFRTPSCFSKTQTIRSVKFPWRPGQPHPSTQKI